MKLRGGMSLGPLNPNNFNGACQVAAAVTAAAAITEKYGGLGETALTKKFKGDWQNTNLIIALVTAYTMKMFLGLETAGMDVTFHSKGLPTLTLATWG